MPECLSNLTIAFPARNEERNLSICLQAIGSEFARRVVVIDSASSDATASVARRHGTEVIAFHSVCHFPKKRNWFLRQHTPPAPNGCWGCGADEILTSAVKRDIAAALPASSHQGFCFLGRRLRKFAIFRVGRLECERIEEDHCSQCDMDVLEHLLLRGSEGLIRSRIDFPDLHGIDSHKLIHIEYAPANLTRPSHLASIPIAFTACVAISEAKPAAEPSPDSLRGSAAGRAPTHALVEL